MDFENNNKSSNIRFPFGKRLFIGIIKFYSTEKGFGYVVSNNLGMSHDKRFTASTQNFYIDKESFGELPKLNKLVVFQPSFQNGKPKALNVRQYNIEKHRELALTYYNKKNSIFILFFSFFIIFDILRRFFRFFLNFHFFRIIFYS